MELQSVSKIDKDVYRKFYQFDAFKKTRWRKILIPTGIVVTIIASIEIFVIINYTYDLDQPVIPLLALMIFLMLFMVVYMWFVMPLIGYKLSAKLYSIDNYFTWYGDHFTVKVDSEELSSVSNYTYDGLLKVWEYNDFLYLYITNNQAHLVPKDSFTKGTWNELKAVLIDQLGNRYEICR